jgi:hypothetical protein
VENEKANETQRRTYKGEEMSRRLIGLQTGITALILSFGLLEAVKAQGTAPLLGGSPAMSYSKELLKRKDVQKELGLDDQQKDALAKLLSRSQVPIVVRPRIHSDISRLSDEERKQGSAEISRQSAEQAAHFVEQRRREVDEILRPDQRKRLTEIDLQWRGILALGEQTLSERLGVSPAHQQRIDEILGDFFVKRLRLLSPSEKTEDPDSPRYRGRRTLLQETEQIVLALLSDEEKSRWIQAVGQPFLFQN